MKRILTDAQKAIVLNSLSEYHDLSGAFDFEIDVSDTLAVNAKGFIEIEGYVEDDYLNGTGSFIETYRNASIDLTAFDENGNEYEVDATEAREYLNAA